MRLAALLMLIRYLGEASGDTGSLQRRGKEATSVEAPVAPAWRHRFEAQRTAFEHGLQSIDAAIPLPQSLSAAEAVSGTITHAELFEAEPAAWCIVDEPELSASGSALRAAKVGPRAAVRERRMSDADELGLLAERYASPLVLEPDRVRRLEARYADAKEFVEENAVVRVDSAFRHEIKARSTFATCAVL